MKKLPNFKLSLIDGSVLKSSSITSKTILFFYPKAMTPGCTVEVNEFQSNLNKFQKLAFTIIGCSKDPIENNIKFAEKYNITHTAPVFVLDQKGIARVVHSRIQKPEDLAQDINTILKQYK